MSTSEKSKEVAFGGIYRHVEGGLYVVIDIVLNATDFETTGTVVRMVRYMQLYDGKYPRGQIWVRNEEQFLELFELVQNP